MNDLIPRYPDMWFILAHTGGSFGAARDGIEVAKKFPNVSLEITLTSVTYRVIEFMVSHVGADRVLFGTDQPMRDPIPRNSDGWHIPIALRHKSGKCSERTCAPFSGASGGK